MGIPRKYIVIFALVVALAIPASILAASNYTRIDRSGETQKIYCGGSQIGEIYTNKAIVGRALVNREEPGTSCFFTIRLEYRHLGSVNKSKASQVFGTPLNCRGVEIGSTNGYIYHQGFGSVGNRSYWSNGVLYPVDELCSFMVRK